VQFHFLRYTICANQYLDHHLPLFTQTHTHARVVRGRIVQVIRFGGRQLDFSR
jgi:hypothetical protein